MTQEQDKERALYNACHAYIAAYARMETAMADGYNVHGAMSGLVGAEDNLRSAIDPQPTDSPDGWLNPEDMAALQRVDGMFQDGEGYDVPDPQMKRLAALGVLRHHSAGRYSITTFGQVVLGVECFRKPLETVDECNARLGREHRAKLGMPAPPTLNASKEGNGHG